MNTSTTLLSQQPRKRRAINACVSCRVSKVKCDGQRPACQRCIKNEAHCQYHDAVKDPTTLRIENLEEEVNILRAGLDAMKGTIPMIGQAGSPGTTLSAQSTTANFAFAPSHTSLATPEANVFATPITSMRPLPQSLTSSHIVPSRTICTAVENGLITWNQASVWFRSFFCGSHYLVPIFCERTDTFESVSSRSAFLFDAIVSIGCRAEEGFSSAIYRRFQSRLREHLTNALIDALNPPTLETVQAIAVMASYSENGFTLIAIALRFALTIGLPDAVDQLMARVSRQLGDNNPEEKELYRLVRVWYGVCNLDLFFSLDGGKLPGITLGTSPRRIRALVKHPERTTVDVRLLSQVELNIIRSNAYNAIVHQYGASLLPENEDLLRSTVHDTTIELSLWLEEWTSIISADSVHDQTSLALSNMHIQYEWALITLHLKALSDSGIENIAIMNDFQRDMVHTAKEAAVRHLHHLLHASSSTQSHHQSSAQVQSDDQPSTYLTTFKWTMDYVWAKCAFSVLLVLKLALLLRDPPCSLILLLRDAHKVLEALKKITVGHISYFQILQVSIEKCESALKENITEREREERDDGNQMGHGGEAVGDGEKDFQGYVPQEFVFEWDFPGLNLRHMPLGWQDLFSDLDNVF
ncbi:hypothetical protein K504DRAFT_485987 [Pleomassaria siparia CBS 279.74]|uniref:Zn(2)-C6 fungal-type domain-containing protein n=1 Tax=Pleomassaria siparia CBS 279.74 TaxID=1314801 RepID=A0A6G1JR06_9PLEO|nr:hypothetical protein K504DRAFT_485987 [Pleomassaria siparia CBS 279.74]